MELNESNNWGDKMTGGFGRPQCPKCGLNCEHDGDRYYNDICFECGWATIAQQARTIKKKENK